MSSPPRFVPADFPGEITLDHVIPAASAVFAPLPADLRPELVAALGRRGIERLYSHQAEAYEAVRRGRHLVVVTPTASGKTLCYNLPVLQRLLEQPEKRALYVYPTKALAQDQLAELGSLKSGLPIDLRVDTYDGDTPPGRRTAIREGGHIVMTNPDMLHTGLLPHHTRWRRLFSSLEFVVIDELHTYRGLFGSQVANVIRRLKRICAFYGSSPTFICASATIRNPLELAQSLLEEEDIALVDRSGAPHGERRLIFYNPPLVNRELGVRRSSMLAARRIAAPWIRVGIQTIVFCRSRLQVEVMLSYLREDLAPRLDASKRVRGYRAGYLPLHRREIEAGLRNGDITAVVSTNALELGIDIGSLQCAVLVGYPGTIASTWQQLGRAGRRSGSVGVFVASSSPLDQFIVRHPEYFLGTDPEEGLIDPDNLLLLAAHLQAGLFELPFMDDERLGGADVQELLRLFEDDGSATRWAGARHVRGTRRPKRHAQPWGSENHQPRVDVQKDPVSHAREHRRGADPPTRADAAHDRLLDHCRRWSVAVARRRNTGSRTPRDGAFAPPYREPAADVRPARPRRGGGGSVGDDAAADRDGVRGVSGRRRIRTTSLRAAPRAARRRGGARARLPMRRRMSLLRRPAASRGRSKGSLSAASGGRRRAGGERFGGPGA